MDSELKLVKPDMQHKDSVLKYRDEFVANGDFMHGGAMLNEIDSYEEWLTYLENESNPETVKEGRVPASEYVAIRTSDDAVVGLINIRHELNDYLLWHGGHIGYSVRPSERKKGYATEMLRLALGICREIGIDRVLVTCEESNTASAKVIEANGGVFENTTVDEQFVTIRRYWITIN